MDRSLEKRTRMVVQEFEEWKESIIRRCQEIFPYAKGPMVSLLVQFIALVDSSKNGSGEKTLKQLRMVSKGMLSEGDFERFLCDFMFEFVAAMRMDRKFMIEVAKEALQRLDKWPGGML